MAVIETWLHQDLQEPVKVNYLDGNLFSNNGNGNRIGVVLTNNGEALASISGTVSGYVVTADGSTVPCTGSKSGNRASILIPAAAYQPGSIFITVFVTDGTTVTTIGAVSTTVMRSRTNAQVDPGSAVTDWTQTINAAMQSVETAAANLGGIVAVPYASITFPVPLGKYTYYDNNLYRCITPIASSESFTAAHWTQVRLGDDVSDLKSVLDLKMTKPFALDPVSASEENGYFKDGSVVSASGWKYLLISVSAGEIYRFNASGNGYVYAYYFCDGSNNVLGHSSESSQKAYTNEMVEIPEGCTKLYLNRQTTSGGVESFNASEIIYSNVNGNDIINDIEELETVKQNKGSYYDPVTASEGNGYFKDGSVTSGAGWKYILLNVEEGETYKFNASGNGYVYAYYLCDSNNTVKSHSSETAQKKYNDEVLTIPTGITKLYINRQTSSDGVASFDPKKLTYTDVNLYEVEKNLDYIDSVIDDFKDYVNQEITNNAGYILTDGSVGGTTNVLFKHSQYISVEGAEKVKVSCYGNGYSQPYYWFASTTGSAVGDYATDSGQTISSDTAVYDYVANVPTGAKYIVCNTLRANKNPIKVALFKPTNYKEKISEMDSEISGLQKPYTGKKLIFFGTSIFDAGAWIKERDVNIPVYIGDLTGATIINNAIASSMARRGFLSNETANDPYGWTDTPWQNVFLAMGATLTEKQDLIDNYETKWKDLIGGDFDPAGQDGTGTGKPSSLTQEWIDKIKAASYESILIPYLDGTYDMPDVFVFEHGHNDYKAGDESATPTEQTQQDMSTYGGAMAFYIRKIFEANPQAKIVIVSHYANDTTKYETIFNAQKAVAEYQHIPFCNVAEKVAWDQRLVTTTGYWGNDGIWVPSGGASQTITRQAQCIKDGTHPSSDKSGKAMFREAGIIADFLIANKDYLIGEQP